MQLYLTKLILTKFKNYEFQTFNFNSKLNLILGENGMGKTNVLEAIHILCLCKNLNITTDKELIKFDEDFARIEGVFNLEGNKNKVVVKIDPLKKKIFEVDDKPVKILAEHIGKLPAVTIFPDDTEIIREGSEKRRRFIDMSISQMDKIYLQHLQAYNQIIAQRNALLKQLNDKILSLTDAKIILENYEAQAQVAVDYIFEKRNDFVVEIAQHIQKFYESIAQPKTRDEKLTLEFESDFQKKDLKTLWRDNLERDIFLTRTTRGLHRDDVHFYLNDKLLKKFGSQGQLRSTVIALKLAQYHSIFENKKIKPLFLLDDIFDKLDAQRVQNLMTILAGDDFGQIFVTDTHFERLPILKNHFEDGYTVFNIENGLVKN